MTAPQASCRAGAGGAPLRERGYRQAARMAVRRARARTSRRRDLTGSARRRRLRPCRRARGRRAVRAAALAATAHQVDPALAVEAVLLDGARVVAGDVLAEMRGPPARCSRPSGPRSTSSGLSGVATRAARREAAGTGPHADTRKTTPGLRALEK